MTARWLAAGALLSLAAGCSAPSREVDITGRWLGKPAADFTLSDLDGQSVTLSALRGKVVLLSFWAVY